MMAPKESSTLSKAQRKPSKCLTVAYIHRDTEYEVILPIRRRKLFWDKSVAMVDGEMVDVTEDAIRCSGPYKDFFGMKPKANQVVRGATSLQCINTKTGKVLIYL